MSTDIGALDILNTWTTQNLMPDHTLGDVTLTPRLPRRYAKFSDQAVLHPTQKIGTLDRLPLETLSDVLLQLDVLTLMAFRSLNRRARNVDGGRDAPAVQSDKVALSQRSGFTRHHEHRSSPLQYQSAASDTLLAAMRHMLGFRRLFVLLTIYLITYLLAGLIHLFDRKGAICAHEEKGSGSLDQPLKRTTPRHI